MINEVATDVMMEMMGVVETTMVMIVLTMTMEVNVMMVQMMVEMLAAIGNDDGGHGRDGKIMCTMEMVWTMEKNVLVTVRGMMMEMMTQWS